MVGNIFRRLFDLETGDGKKVSLFVAFVFLSAVVAFSGLAIGDGLFLEYVGAEGLPLAFLIISCGLLLFSTLTLKALRYRSVQWVYFATYFLGLLFFATAALTFTLFQDSTSLFPYYFCKVGAMGFMMCTYTSLWSFVDAGFGPQDAKRLYGILNSAYVIGAASGSGLISLLIETFGARGLLLLISATTLIVFVLARQILKRYPPLPEQQLTQVNGGEKIQSFPKMFREIIRSRFILFLLSSNILVLLLEIVTEYNYMASVAEIFSAKASHHLGEATSNELTQFLGGCRAWVFMGDMLFGILIYGRLVRRIGLKNLILIPSMSFVVLFAAWSFHNVLIMAVLGLIAVEGVCSAIEDSNFNLLMNTVSPRLKARLRVIVEQFFEPMGMLLTSLILASVQNSKILGLIMAIVALVVVILVRAAYPQVEMQQSEETKEGARTKESAA